MDCQLCQKELDEYPGGNTDGNLNNQVKAHLEICEDCAVIYGIRSLAESVISFEKAISPDNNLSATIMARIEKEEDVSNNGKSLFIRILKPALITSSMAAAIFAGVLMGNIYKPISGEPGRPIELTLIDDAAIESVDILSNQ